MKVEEKIFYSCLRYCQAYGEYMSINQEALIRTLRGCDDIVTRNAEEMAYNQLYHSMDRLITAIDEYKEYKKDTDRDDNDEEV